MLYKLNKDDDRENYEKVKRVTLQDMKWKEKDLERLMAQNIYDFISSNDLMTLFTERQGKEEPDILALDRNGDLYIFELKRWEGKQENLLQVLRYAQNFGNSNYYYLNDLFRKHHKTNEELAEFHASYFFGDTGKQLPKDQFNSKQHFIVVTNGVDQETVESIIYWKSVGLNIDAIVYWVFEIAGEYYIEFNTYSQIEDYIEYENKYYIVNTDRSNSVAHHEAMLNEKKAAAYGGDFYTKKIKKLQKGDTVFLYSSGEGIVAYGKADGKVNKVAEGGIEENEYNMHLTDFKKLDTPISAARIKEITHQGFIFTQTMFAVSEEAALKLIKHIKSKK